MVRWFVRMFLASFVVCAMFGIDAWPLSGWRLFSTLRPDHVTSWRAMVVDSSGRERALPLSRLPAGYRNFALIAPRFRDLDRSEQIATCDAWMAAARDVGAAGGRIRLYRVEQDLVPRAGSEAANAPAISLAFECGDGTVRAFGPGA